MGHCDHDHPPHHDDVHGQAHLGKSYDFHGLHDHGHDHVYVRGHGLHGPCDHDLHHHGDVHGQAHLGKSYDFHGLHDHGHDHVYVRGHGLHGPCDHDLHH